MPIIMPLLLQNHLTCYFYVCLAVEQTVQNMGRLNQYRNIFHTMISRTTISGTW